LLAVTTYKKTMLYFAAAQGASWLISWLVLKDFYSPEEICRAMAVPANGSTGTEAVPDADPIVLNQTPISNLATEGSKSPQSMTIQSDTPQTPTPHLHLRSSRLLQVSMSIPADMWRYNIVPRFRRTSDKITFWALFAGLTIGTL
jgi:hypothetical protein